MSWGGGAQFEIAINFLTGFYANEHYCDDVRLIARHYMSSPFRFWFDILTSIPLSWIDWGILQASSCAAPSALL